MRTPEIFDAAADYIQTFGGARYFFGQYGRPRCGVGALRSVLGDDSREVFHASRTFRRVMGTSLMTLNDDAKRPSDVATALREAAARLRGEGK